MMELSLGSLLRAVLFLLALWFLFYVRDIVAMVFVAIIVAVTLSPLVDGLAKTRLPRALVILLIYLLVLTGLGVFLYFVIPPLVIQLKQLADLLPNQSNGIGSLFVSIRDIVSQALPATQGYSLQDVSNFIGQFFTKALGTTIGFFNVMAAIASVFVLSLYMLLEEDGIKKFFVSFLPIKQKNQLVKTGLKISKRLGGWLRGQFLLGIAIGVCTYIGLLILQVPYALTLAIIAGVLEIIPIIGPILAALPAIVVAFITMSPVMAIIVVIFYVLLQELENKILVPQIMRQAVGLNPITIIISLLIGAKLMGIVGMLLAVPLVSALYVILEDWVLISEPSK